MATDLSKKTRTRVLHASYDGFKAAITSAVASRFTWESVNDAPSLLFLGAGQVLGAELSQDTWFDFDTTLQKIRYIVRLTEVNEDKSSYGNSRGIFEAELTLDEAADLLEMCIHQALGENALQNREPPLASAKLRDD